MLWRGRDLITVHDLVGALEALKSREEAQQFMTMYKERTAHAEENIGYLTGYLSDHVSRRIMDWCEVSHPIFGKRFPSQQEAYDAGIAHRGRS